MKTYFIIRFHKSKPARAFAYTNDKDVAMELCDKEETHGSNWFFGWSEDDGYRGCNVHQLAKAEGYLSDIARNPGKKVTQ